MSDAERLAHELAITKRLLREAYAQIDSLQEQLRGTA